MDEEWEEKKREKLNGKIFHISRFLPSFLFLPAVVTYRTPIEAEVRKSLLGAKVVAKSPTVISPSFHKEGRISCERIDWRDEFKVRHKFNYLTYGQLSIQVKEKKKSIWLKVTRSIIMSCLCCLFFDNIFGGWIFLYGVITVMACT